MFEHREEMLGWLFTYRTHKFHNLRGMYYDCELLVNLDRFSAGTRVDEITIDYQYGILELVRHPVSAMDRHENLGVYEITPVIEGVDYMAIREEIAQATEEAQTQVTLPQEQHFQSADLAIAMLDKFKLPNYTEGFIERDEDDTRPVNERG